MFLPRQLLVTLLAFLLFSCDSTSKQKDLSASADLTRDTVMVVSTKTGITPETKSIITKNIVALETIKTQKDVAARSNGQVQTSIESDFRSIEKSFQEFTVNTNLDTTILCKEGTVIKIKHSSFLIASSSTEVKGTIKFQVKEFYKISDIVSARLTTLSNDNILETGGTIFIQAIAEGQLCKLKENSPIEISFPFKEKKENMLLFSGSWTDQKINWLLLPEKEAAQIQIVEQPATFPGGAVALRNFMLKNLAYPDTLGAMGNGEMVQMDFVIDETGKAKDVNFKNSSQKGFKDAILETFSKMPRWKPAKRNGAPIKSTYFQSITFSNTEQSTKDTVFKNNFESTINNTNISQVKTFDIRQYIFSTSKLGWINCDRFYNNPTPRTDFYVDCGDYTEIDVNLVFHSFKAVLNNASTLTAKFKNIPDNEAVTVVVVKKVNNDTFISLTESNTNLKSIRNLAFEKVTMEKLKQKLEQLNTIK